MSVQVPCGEITFKETQYNALRVTVRDTEGELAKAGFETGDLIIAINGQEFRGAMQMQMAFATAASKEGDAKLTLLRGGQRLEVTVNAKKLMTSGRKMGGSIRPSVR